MSKKHKPQFRHELKYHINTFDYRILSDRLKATLKPDPNAGESGEYFIRSLYFDDPADTALREKLAGVDLRDKYRVRIYNLSPDTIKLERKRKESGFIRKDSLTISRAEYESLAAGDFAFLYDRDTPIARTFYEAFATHALTSRVIVDYMREPYIFPYGNVRITFDKNLRTAYRATDLFSASMPTYPVLDKGDMVLEVKFDKVLPDYIRSLLQIDTPLRSAVSKYAICRKFEL